MNLLRFAKKCLSDPPAAWRSAKLVARLAYGNTHWALCPNAPLRWRLGGGGAILLHPGHSFTHCFWPAIDDYEPDVRAGLQHFLRRGDIFVDCGANIGFFSVIAGRIVGDTGRVISIEANPNTYQILSHNLQMNRCGTPVSCALTSRPGDVDLFVPRAGGDVYSSLRTGGLVNGAEIDTFKVTGRTLDEVIESVGLDRINVLKIDIEGGELDVLRSAPHVLRTMRPVIFCEYGINTWPAFGASSDDLLRLLADHEYAAGIFDVKANQVRPAADAVWRSPYANLVLQPREALPD